MQTSSSSIREFARENRERRRRVPQSPTSEQNTRVEEPPLRRQRYELEPRNSLTSAAVTDAGLHNSSSSHANVSVNPRRSSRLQGRNTAAYSEVQPRQPVAEAKRQADTMGLIYDELTGTPETTAKHIRERRSLIENFNPGLLDTLEPLPTLDDWQSYSHLPFLQGLDDTQKQRSALCAYKLTHALREFQISDSLYTVTHCAVCDLIWIEDGDNLKSKDKNSWKTQLQAWRCSCRTCGNKFSDAAIHSTNRAPPQQKRILCCSRCYKSLKSKDEICPMIGIMNLMYISPIPDVLCGLSFAEKAAISRVACIMNCKTLKGGIRSMQGNCSFLMQDQSSMIDVLPRIPSETNIIIFKRKSSTARYIKTYPVRRAKIKNALVYLVKHFPGYHGVTLDENNFNKWPEDGYVSFKDLSQEQQTQAIGNVSGIEEFAISYPMTKQRRKMLLILEEGMLMNVRVHQQLLRI